MCRIIRRIATAALDFPASVPYTGPVASPPFVGIDLVEPSRLAERLERNPSLGMTLFTNRERGYCIAQHHPEQHLAARYCAKEAVIKALASHAKFIRGRVSGALRQMKYMPEFRFRLDTSYDNMAKIDQLLRSPEVARDLDHETPEEDENEK